MLGRQRPLSPSLPAEAGCLFTVAAGVHVFISGESLHCFLAGWCTNKNYVIATSDLWLFIHASNLLPSTPHPTPLQNLALASRIGSRGVTHWPGDIVEELSGGTGDSVAELSGTEAVWWGPDHRASPTLRQFEGTWPPSFTYTDGWSATATATGSNPLPGARSLDSQALRHQGMLHSGVGAAVPSTVPEEWDPPLWAGWPTSWYPCGTAGSAQLTLTWCPRRGQGLYQHLREMHCGAML